MTATFSCLTTINHSVLSPVIFKVVVGPSASTSNFRHPILTDEEAHLGCRLGIDSWADTSCAGRHAHVLEFVEGRTVTAHGFASSLTPIANLSIANVAYAYDSAEASKYDYDLLFWQYCTCCINYTCIALRRVTECPC